MSNETLYYVALFKSVSYALKAERILKAAGLPHKLVPVPKQISSDCGICLRLEEAFLDQITDALADKVGIEEIRPLIHESAVC